MEEVVIKLVATMVILLLAMMNSMVDVKWIIRLSNTLSTIKGRKRISFTAKYFVIFCNLIL